MQLLHQMTMIDAKYIQQMKHMNITNIRKITKKFKNQYSLHKQYTYYFRPKRGEPIDGEITTVTGNGQRDTV